MPFRLPGPTWFALALVPAVLLAEDPEPALHFGLQATLATPRQDLRDVTSRTGMGGGLFFEQDLDGTWSVRSRLDYLSFSQGTARITAGDAGFIPATAVQAAVNQTSLGAEVRLHPKDLSGIFFLAGACGSRLEFRSVGPDPSGVLSVLETKQKTSFKLGWSAGVGCTLFSACTATFRYTNLQIAGANFATAELGLDYRF